jgi:uncharacterized membrane protein YesL
MTAGLRVWWQGLCHLNHRGYIYIWANFLWFLLSLPVITAPAAWAGLIKLSRTAYLTPTADLNDFWEGFRENLKRGAMMAVLNVVVFVVNMSNLLAYQHQRGLPALLMRGIWLLALVVWIVLQFYMWPLLYELKQPSLSGALRNAAMMTLHNPLFTLGLSLGVILTAIAGTVITVSWVVITASAIAAISTGAVLDRLAAAGLRAPVPETPSGDGEYNSVDSE